MQSEYLNNLKKGQTGTITELPDGKRVKQKLKEMGLRLGMDISITQVMPMSGPVIIRAGQTQIAIGHSMASRIKINFK